MGMIGPMPPKGETVSDWPGSSMREGPPRALVTSTRPSVTATVVSPSGPISTPRMVPRTTAVALGDLK
ncbi:hypothetical protein D3C72_859360 [compost metagenome]